MPIDDVRTRYYLRVGVADRPGVLALVAGRLGDAGISIASLIQKEVDTDVTEIVIMTHEAREANLRGALEAIRKLDGVLSIEQTLRVLS
jgi:homoserine dehydrogenase